MGIHGVPCGGKYVLSVDQNEQFFQLAAFKLLISVTTA